MKERGSIIRLVRDRGFGFLRSDTGEEFFFHRSTCARTSPFESLSEQDNVEFDEGRGPKGPRAENVERI